MGKWLNAHIVVATNIHTSYAPKRGEVQQSGNGDCIVLTVVVINTIPNIALRHGVAHQIERRIKTGFI